jgi:hypothetical protein
VINAPKERRRERGELYLFEPFSEISGVVVSRKYDLRDAVYKFPLPAPMDKKGR